MADFTPTFDNPQMTDWAPGTNTAAPTPAPAQAAQPAAADDPLAQDATYQAFSRALGLQKSNAETNTQQQVGQLESQRQPTLDWMGHQNDLANQHIGGSMEARGILRSGETEQNLANQGAAYGRQSSLYTQGLTDRETALQQALAGQQTDYATRDAEQRAAATGRIAQGQADAQLATQQADYQQALLDALRSGAAIPGPNVTAAGVGAGAGAAAPASLASFHLSPSESYIVSREDASGDPTARNPSSGAFGIGQLNPSSGRLQSVAKEVGADPNTTDPATQVAMMRRYISDRYGTADAAAAHERQYGWY